MRERVLIIDDDQAVRSSLRRYLQKSGFAVDEADSCQSAEVRFRAFAPKVALIDYCLPDGEAFSLLPRLRHIDPSCTLFVLTGHGTIDLAVRAVKEGAAEFLTKPVDMATLLRAVQIGVRAARGGLARMASVEPFFGESAAMRALHESVAALASSDDSALLIGEKGTGRSTLARWIHATSRRAGAPFVELDCAASSSERELFGFEGKRAASRLGVLEATEGGTVFLERIDRAPLSLQRSLVDVLRRGRFQRIRSADPRTANVRVMASSAAELGAVGATRAREPSDPDLAEWFARRSLAIPALRDRGEDVVSLARHLVSRLATRHGRGSVALAAEAEAHLKTYAWPGNLRELEKVLESAIVLGSGPVLGAGELRLDRRRAGSERITLDELQRRTIDAVLRDEHGHVEAAARRLGIPRSTLYYKMKLMGLATREAAHRKAEAPHAATAPKTPR